MAKLKRYDLYEGDDEFISSSLPGKKPLGRDEGLRERDAYDRRKEEEAEKRRRYFAANEKDDGLPSLTILTGLNSRSRSGTSGRSTAGGRSTARPGR